MKLHDAIVEKNFCSLFDMSEIFQIIIFGKSSISVFMVSGAILTFAQFLKIGESR